MKTYLVLPAVTELAGRLTIVFKEAQGALGLSDYRANPDGWLEAGLVDAHDGHLVCLDASRKVYEEFKACEPIWPPLVITEPS